MIRTIVEMITISYKNKGKLDNVLNSATKIQPSLAVEMQLLTIMKKQKMPMY